MNIETLESILAEVQDLKSTEHLKAETLKIKVVDAFSTLNLDSPSTVEIGFLKFTPQWKGGDNPFEISKNKLIGHLESKILILKKRNIEASTREYKQQSSAKAYKEFNNTLELSKKEQRILELENEIADKQKSLNNLMDENDRFEIMVGDLENKIGVERRWRFAKSGTVWSIIIGACIAICIWTYDLGKDNATKMDDTEKATLRKTVNELNDSIKNLNLKIDSKKISNEG